MVDIYINMNMAINVYEYRRGGKCIYLVRYTYAGTREMKMQIEKENRHRSWVMLDTHTQEFEK